MTKPLHRPGDTVYIHGWLRAHVVSVGQRGYHLRVTPSDIVGSLDALAAEGILTATPRRRPRSILGLDVGPNGALAIIGTEEDAFPTTPEDTNTSSLHMALVGMGFKAGPVKQALAALGERARSQPLAQSIREALGILTR